MQNLKTEIAMPKTLILDYSKWRCGDDSKYKLGNGDTMMENSEGFQCCLGQFSLQLNSGLASKDIMDIASPSSLLVVIPDLVNKGAGDWFTNSSLAEDAMVINDATYDTARDKIKLLKDLFDDYGYGIKVINQRKKSAKKI